MASILRACPKRRGAPRPALAKTITADAVQDFGDVYEYDMTPLDFGSFDDMVSIIDWLKDEPTYCVIRGDAVQAGPAQRRLLRDQADGAKATIVASPGQSWIMLDIDKRPADPGLTTNDERLEFLISKLPPEFHDATYYYKWSSKAGRAGWDYLSCHLWFWMDEPQTCANLHKRASRGGDWFNMVDPSVFTPNQIHYTAAPIFVGVDDPCEGFRSGVVRKALPAAPVRHWTEPYRPRPVFTRRQSEARNPGASLSRSLDEIGVPFYHQTIRNLIWDYIRDTPSALWEKAALFEKIKERVVGSGRDYLTFDKIDGYLEHQWDGANYQINKSR